MPSCPQLFAAGICSAPSAAGWAISCLAVGLFVASFARGYSGFGFSALLVASWSLLVAPSLPVAVAMLLEVSASVLQAVSVWRQVDWRRVGILLGGAAFGTPLGVAVLAIAEPAMLRALISAVLLVSCCALLAGYTLARPVGVAGELAVGCISGLVNGATAMGGLPVALFLAASATAPAVMRATFIAYFFGLDILSSLLLAHQGVLTGQTLAIALLCLPVLALGLWLGGRHFLGASPAQFRRHTLWLLIALAALGLARAVASG